nr:MAG TPA: Melittin [Caudoviricetes sp.]
MEILTIISWIKRNRKIISKAILIALVALSVASSIFLYK